MADDSDEDDLVTYGTSLEPIDDDAARRKPVLLEDQVVTDKQGRRRFHGAFTGGFSAGYFNSVGSKKGWEPATFTSSRGQSSMGSSNQRAEDFMDDEDLGDFGIAPRKIVTTGKFTNEETQRKRRAPVGGPSIIPGESPLQDLIVPSNDSMGARLLRKMGWRHGQGIGAKVRRRKKKSALIDTDPGAPESDSGDGDDSNFYQGFLFAPADVDEIAMTPKDDHHGIGYRGLDPALAGMGRHVSLFEEPVNSRGGKRGISGQAFGIGAFEAADDEIYSSDSLANYDRVLGGEEPGGSKYGWTAPPDRHKGSAGVLENFKASAERRNANTVYPPPVLPKDFRPFHVMKASSKENQPPAADYQSSRFTLSATQRGAMLDEEQLPGPSSVFDFLSPEDRQKLKSNVPTQSQVPPQQEGKSSRLPHRGFSQPPSSAPAVPTASDPQRSWELGGAFQPFASNPEKQARYDQFLAKKRDGKVSDKDDESQTEWERQRETEEFNRAASLYRPLSGLMATRFVTAKSNDNDDKEDVQAEEGGDKSEQAKAAEMKMFGKLTRDSLEWHPDNLLCKRFNVPHPYPGSTTVGLTKVKKDKFSIFNFLSIATPSAEPAPPREEALDKGVDRVGSHEGGNPHNEKGSRWDRRPALLANVGVSEGGDVSIDPVSKGSEDQSEMLSSLKPLENPGSENRPPMDLFKAIFASSSEEDESDDDDDEEEGVAKEQQGQKPNDETCSTTSKPTGMSTANQHFTLGISTATSSPHAAGNRQPEVLHSTASSGSESDGYYGPRLPPPSSDPTQRVSNEVRGHNSQREPASSQRDTNGVHVKAKTHHKEKRRKKHDRQSTGKHKRSKDKKHKPKKKKKSKGKDGKVRHKGHHRSPSRSKSGHKGHRRQPTSEYDYDASGDSTSSSSDSS